MGIATTARRSNRCRLRSTTTTSCRMRSLSIRHIPVGCGAVTLITSRRSWRRAKVASVTLSEWEAELRELRLELGSMRSMRVRWYTKSHLEPGASGATVLFGDGISETVMLALYDLDASPGDRPRVEIEVQPNADIYAVPQGSTVEVAGTPDPGHAAVVLIGVARHWPVYPGVLTRRAPKL